MRMKLENFSVSLPWGMGGVSVDVSEEAERAAWSLYVELSTRVSTKPLQEGEGSVREALTSLYKLFGITREVLKAGGLDVAKAGKGRESLGTIAISFLNEVIRPFLVKWHTSLSGHEAATWKRMLDNGETVPNNPAVASSLVDESAMDGYGMFYEELEELQKALRAYVTILGTIAGAAGLPNANDDDSK